MDIIFQVNPSIDPNTIPFVYEHPEIGRDTYTFPNDPRAVADVVVLYQVADNIDNRRARLACFERARVEGRRLAITCTLGGAT